MPAALEAFLNEGLCSTGPRGVGGGGGGAERVQMPFILRVDRRKGRVEERAWIDFHDWLSFCLSPVVYTRGRLLCFIYFFVFFFGRGGGKVKVVCFFRHPPFFRSASDSVLSFLPDF